MTDNIGNFNSSTNTDAITTTNSSTGRGIYSSSVTGTAVEGHTTGSNANAGFFTSTGTNSNGVYAQGVAYGIVCGATGSGGTGISVSASGYAISATSTGSQAIHASTSGANAVAGVFTASGTNGIGITASGTNGAAAFSGAVSVSGYLTKSGGGYRIDHPMDPENKFLNHNFVESPEMMNVYRGRVTLDVNGEATVVLPSYFCSANETPEFQLTAIGAAMPNLHVAQEIINCAFKLAGGIAGKSVSWQVTAARSDGWAKANNPGVEIDKGNKKGLYLHPELFGLGIDKILKP